MANDDFFNDKNDKVEDQQQDDQLASTFKLGEKEYSQEELQKLVGLGEQAQELETKWDTKIDRLMPEYSRSREELKTLREQAEEKAQQKIEAKEQQGEQLSAEEQAKILRTELKKHKVVFEDELDSYYVNRRSGEQLLEKIEKVVTKAQAEEQPKTSTEELLTYMSESGIKDPQVAYEVMFRKQLREQEMQKLDSIRPAGIYTTTSSTAGAKTPPAVSITKANLSDALSEVLSRGGG